MFSVLLSKEILMKFLSVDRAKRVLKSPGLYASMIFYFAVSLALGPIHYFMIFNGTVVTFVLYYIIQSALDGV